MKSYTRTSVVYGPNYDPNKAGTVCFEFRTVAKARTKAILLGIGSRIVFWQNVTVSKFRLDSFTEPVELEFTSKGFKKRK